MASAYFQVRTGTELTPLHTFHHLSAERVSVYTTLETIQPTRKTMMPAKTALVKTRASYKNQKIAQAITPSARVAFQDTHQP